MDNSSLSKEQRLRIEENKRRALAKRQQRSQGQTVYTGQQTTTQNATKVLSEPASSSNNSTARLNAPQPLQVSRTSSHPVTAKPQVTGSGTVPRYNLDRPSTSRSVVSPYTGQKTAAAFGRNKNSGTWHNKGSRPSESQLGGLGKSQFYGQAQKRLRGQCVLISRDRFEVNIGFSQPVVEAFKTINSRVYGKVYIICIIYIHAYFLQCECSRIRDEQYERF